MNALSVQATLMTGALRFVALAALMVWQGGFIFYIAIVVPIGTSVLGSATQQGFITQRVTASMNWCGAVALALLALEWITGCKNGSRRVDTVRAVLWLCMTAAAIGLFTLHGRLDALLDASSESVIDRQAFRPLHRAYLWISSVEWGCAVIYLALSLRTWMYADRKLAGETRA